MNREIKFRAWDPDDKEMYDPMVLAVVDNASLSLSPLRKCKDGNRAYKPHHPLMQFTGVMHRDCEKYRNKDFDKNGNAFYKEVFEGDIVEFKVDPSFYIKAKLGDRYIIEYFGAGFFMKPISWGNKKIDAQNYVGLLQPYQTSNMRNHYEVIGNIYENPELLE